MNEENSAIRNSRIANLEARNKRLEDQVYRLQKLCNLAWLDGRTSNVHSNPDYTSWEGFVERMDEVDRAALTNDGSLIQSGQTDGT